MYYEKFEGLCRQFNVTAADVSRATGVATSTLSNWKNGKYTPKMEKLKKIADFFGVKSEYFTGETKEKPGIILDAEQEKVLEMFRNATPEVRQIVLAVLKTGTQQP